MLHRIIDLGRIEGLEETIFQINVQSYNNYYNNAKWVSSKPLSIIYDGRFDIFQLAHLHILLLELLKV